MSNWLSVDPLAEKTMTPYQYVNQNPIRYVDPTGMEGESSTDWGLNKSGEWEYFKGTTVPEGKDYQRVVGDNAIVPETSLSVDGVDGPYSDVRLKKDGFAEYTTRGDYKNDDGVAGGTFDVGDRAGFSTAYSDTDSPLGLLSVDIIGGSKGDSDVEFHALKVGMENSLLKANASLYNLHANASWAEGFGFSVGAGGSLIQAQAQGTPLEISGFRLTSMLGATGGSIHGGLGFDILPRSFLIKANFGFGIGAKGGIKVEW